MNPSPDARRKCSAAVEVVPDFEADGPEQHQRGEEGVQHDKVQRVAGQGARVPLLDDVVPIAQDAGSWQNPWSVP